MDDIKNDQPPKGSLLVVDRRSFVAGGAAAAVTGIPRVAFPAAPPGITLNFTVAAAEVS